MTEKVAAPPFAKLLPLAVRLTLRGFELVCTSSTSNGHRTLDAGCPWSTASAGRTPACSMLATCKLAECAMSSIAWNASRAAVAVYRLRRMTAHADIMPVMQHMYRRCTGGMLRRACRCLQPTTCRRHGSLRTVGDAQRLRARRGVQHTQPLLACRSICRRRSRQSLVILVLPSAHTLLVLRAYVLPEHVAKHGVCHDAVVTKLHSDA